MILIKLCRAELKNKYGKSAKISSSLPFSYHFDSKIVNLTLFLSCRRSTDKLKILHAHSETAEQRFIYFTETGFSLSNHERRPTPTRNLSPPPLPPPNPTKNHRHIHSFATAIGFRFRLILKTDTAQRYLLSHSDINLTVSISAPLATMYLRVLLIDIDV